MKVAVLQAYELVPEAYWQKFRRLKRHGGQSFTEFVCEKEALFDRWCSSSGVSDFCELKQLILMEDFKNCLPEAVSTYLNEHKVKDVCKAAVLVEEYMLTHKPMFLDRPFNKFVGGMGRCAFEGGKTSAVAAVRKKTPALTDSVKIDKGDQFSKDGVKCFYCKKKGHIVADCPVLARRNMKPVALVDLWGLLPLLILLHLSWMALFHCLVAVVRFLSKYCVTLPPLNLLFWRECYRSDRSRL